MDVVKGKSDTHDQQIKRDTVKRSWHSPELRKINLREQTKSFDGTSISDFDIIIS